MIARRHWFPVYGLGNIEIKYLGAIQNQCQQLFADMIMLFSIYISICFSNCHMPTWIRKAENVWVGNSNAAYYWTLLKNVKLFICYTAIMQFFNPLNSKTP